MATLLDLKTRIIGETHREDLETDLASVFLTHIQDACEYYADMKFWFNSVLTTAATVNGQAYVNVPATVRVVERVTIPASGIELRETVLSRLPEGTVTGRPSVYAYLDDTLRLYPVPGGVYTLNIYGVEDVAAPAADADDNIWTNEASRLIAAHVRMTLARDVFMDEGATTLALASVQDNLRRLRRETGRRLQAPLTVDPAVLPSTSSTYDMTSI